jgi:ABC-2 type transport system permease protein
MTPVREKLAEWTKYPAFADRSREQLNGFGSVVVLGMSAIGGSMIPRMFMPDWLKQVGFLTINGWAYDGFMDLVTGRGFAAMALELFVLLAAGIVLATIGSILLSGRLRSSGVQTT